MTDTDLAPLQWLVAYQMGLHGLTWALCSLLLRESRAAMAHWGLFLGMLGAGLVLASLREEPRQWLYYNGANILAILAFAMMRRGSEKFMKVDRHDHEQLVLLVPVVL